MLYAMYHSIDKNCIAIKLSAIKSDLIPGPCSTCYNYAVHKEGIKYTNALVHYMNIDYIKQLHYVCNWKNYNYAHISISMHVNYSNNYSNTYVAI